MNSYTEFWEPIRSYCRENMNSIAFNMWIDPLKLIKIEADRAIVSAPGFKIDLIMTKYKSFIEEAFYNIMGFNVELEIIPEENIPKENSEIISDSSSNSSNIKNEKFTFNNFVVGPSNKFAYTASLRVAENPGSVFNPLFIYGNSGLGKTHLLNAIIEKLKSNNPDAVIVYTTSEDITNDLYFAIQTKTTHDLHQKYRTCDALLIDDIQMIAGKTQTEEEIFHTFDTLIKAGKQIVLTSDKPPSAIPKIEDRLKTRFESGLLCDIQPPDFETRMAIIKDKANYLRFELPDDVCSFIAENIKSNVRQMGSAVKNIYAYCSFNNVIPTVDIVKDILKDILITSLPVSVVVENIIEKVSFTFGVTSEQLKSERRDANINNARQAAMYIIREITGLSQDEVGKVFGRNHSTVNSSLKNVQQKISSDLKYKNLINDIIKNIND
ncbi:MAG: chromosomal replication initiator protein DnaA [Clostridia bacterium]|nr:chromosomal replication initiator protein DnaA [Clostridia bacterium]MBR5245860.1 chromosomal replication initiator protein DnaA [Clostridia bacterium]